MERRDSSPQSVACIEPRARAGALFRAGLRILLGGLLLLIVAAFLFSLGRAADWTSSGLGYQVFLGDGAFSFAWRPVGWTATSSDPPGLPGFSTSMYGDWPGLQWLPHWGENRSWQWWNLPLWIPATLCLVTLLLLVETSRFRRRSCVAPPNSGSRRPSTRT